MREQIKSLLQAFSFDQVQSLGLTRPISLSFYKDWLDENKHGEMSYLKKHLPIKKNLTELLPEAQSVIVVTENYYEHPHPLPVIDEFKQGLKIAKYAQGVDYHFWFKEKLQKACAQLQEEFPEEIFMPVTDSQPVLERDFAYQAGLGWFGKNTCLIHSDKGSYFLIGEILTSLKIQDSENKTTQASIEVHPDRCGNCTRCIEACPTEALEDKKLDASKCISYWTIESKTTPPLSLAKNFQSWFFGCDICQDVCPWNQKFIRKNKKPELQKQVSRSESLKQIIEILSSSNKALEKKFFGTPLTRPRGFGLKRNALILALNLLAFELIKDLEDLDLGPKLSAFQEQVLTELKSLKKLQNPS